MIKGGQVQGKGVTVTAENLHIESVQDTSRFKGKQQNISGQITVGYGASGSASYSQSKINADHQSVSEQSGIFAGEDGYQINVKDRTDLKGGLITSSQSAEDAGKNRFATGTLTHSHIHNYSSYNGNSFGLEVSGSIGGGESRKEIGGQKLIGFGNNKTVTDAQTGQETIQGQVSASSAVGYGSDKDSRSSTTRSGIGTKNIVIANNEARQKLSSQTAEQTAQSLYTNIRTETAEAQSGRLKNMFDKEKVLKELDIQVKVTKDFRKNAFAAIDGYVLPKQAELREQIKLTKDKKEQDKLYEEIYKLQYTKRILETMVGIVSGVPEASITQGTLQLAATKYREETLKNSRLFPGISDGETTLTNTSYESGYFDGVKLGGVRIDLDAICGNRNQRCKVNDDGSYRYIGGKTEDGTELKTLKDAINPKLNPKAQGMYGFTGGFQAIQGTMMGQYVPGSFKDMVIESFAGTHDIQGGQMWGLYDDKGNTTRGRGDNQHPNRYDDKISSVTAAVAIPTSEPFAISDLLSPDMLQILLKIGGH